MSKIFSLQPVVLFPLSTDLRPNIFVRQIKKMDCKTDTNLRPGRKYTPSTGDAF